MSTEGKSLHELAPRASALIESMRDIGYSFEAAIADLIDNSIFAGALNVTIDVPVADGVAPWLAVIDDGRGMSEAELHEAMRPGSASPSAERAATDLGRFGLGLKTASFSQCRRLSVVSCRQGIVAGRRWDLDVVAETNQWLVEKLSSTELARLPQAGALTKRGSGTLVVWEHLDRLGGPDPQGVPLLLQHMEITRRHLGLVFHRYLGGEGGKGKLAISTNGLAISPFDPFATGLSEPLPLTRIDLPGGVVEVQPYKLPHHSRISTAEWEHLAGEDGYLRSQGFYVYRNRRLIIHGTWFRLARQTELTKLLRVRVDIPASLDHLWQIDVRKSRAQPPDAVRRRLKEIIDRILDAGRRIYDGKAVTVLSKAKTPAWQRVSGQGRIWYAINRDYPVVSELFRSIPDDDRQLLDNLVETLERSLPVDAIFADAGGNQSGLRQDDGDRDSLAKLAAPVIELLREDGVADRDILSRLLSMEPFANHPDICRQLLAEWGVTRER
jgi:hypothetical protein